jgi:hypothetical protein
MSPELRAAFGRTATRVAVAEQLPPGPRLISELTALKAAPTDAPTAARVHALWGKVASWVSAQQMLSTYTTVYGIRGMLEPGSLDEAQMLAAQELACETHVPFSTAMSHVSLVERVAQVMPASWMALDRGEITLTHLKAIERETRHCPPRVAEAVDTQVIPQAVQRGWTPSQAAQAARKLVIALDPYGADDRHAAAKDGSDVEFYPLPDGVAGLNATGEAVLTRRIFDTVNATAEQMARDGDDRPKGVRRFHALAGLVLGETDRPTAGRGETLLVMDLPTFVGADDRPAELIGYGAITADAARRIAADTSLRRLIADPLTGETIDLGLRSYRPSAALRRAMQATHPTCTMVGCSRPAHSCEADHRDERHDGGRTDLANLQPLCKMHHQMKTKKRWRVDVNPDGTQSWTSYLGRTYTKKSNYFTLPEPLPADDEPPDEIADRLPAASDPDPPHPDEPLPEPPPLTDEQLEEFEHALDTLDAFGETFRQWCDRYYDEARATGLVA